jgi:4-diphosphocytidyl-2-C-methyl-D-erythritol kinase
MMPTGATARPADPLAVHPALPPAFPGGGDGAVLAAPAKLNLFLEILGKRPDGYHDLESLMVAVDLFDTLELRGTATGTVALTCEPATLSAGPDNLVHRAAAALRNRANRPDLGAEIRLTKRIPTQAGLGGGSSDAAAALVGLNRIWKLGLTRQELVAIAAPIGCTGRGERVTPEPTPTGRDGAAGFYFVLVCPPVGLGTADVYKRLAVPARPEPGDAVRAAFRAGGADALGRALFNRLEGPAFGAEPLVGRIRHRLGALGPCGALMSGSGSAVFAVCRDRDHAVQVAGAFQDARPADEPESRVLIVRSLSP